MLQNVSAYLLPSWITSWAGEIVTCATLVFAIGLFVLATWLIPNTSRKPYLEWILLVWFGSLELLYRRQYSVNAVLPLLRVLVYLIYFDMEDAQRMFAKIDMCLIVTIVMMWAGIDCRLLWACGSEMQLLQNGMPLLIGCVLSLACKDMTGMIGLITYLFAQDYVYTSVLLVAIYCVVKHEWYDTHRVQFAAHTMSMYAYVRALAFTLPDKKCLRDEETNMKTTIATHLNSRTPIKGSNARSGWCCLELDPPPQSFATESPEASCDYVSVLARCHAIMFTTPQVAEVINQAISLMTAQGGGERLSIADEMGCELYGWTCQATTVWRKKCKEILKRVESYLHVLAKYNVDETIQKTVKEFVLTQPYAQCRTLSRDLKACKLAVTGNDTLSRLCRPVPLDIWKWDAGVTIFVVMLSFGAVIVHSFLQVTLSNMTHFLSVWYNALVFVCIMITLPLASQGKSTLWRTACLVGMSGFFIALGRHEQGVYKNVPRLYLHSMRFRWNNSNIIYKPFNGTACTVIRQNKDGGWTTNNPNLFLVMLAGCARRHDMVNVSNGKGKYTQHAWLKFPHYSYATSHTSGCCLLSEPKMWRVMYEHNTSCELYGEYAEIASKSPQSSLYMNALDEIRVMMTPITDVIENAMVEKMNIVKDWQETACRFFGQCMSFPHIGTS
jgi:hypothetical protein